MEKNITVERTTNTKKQGSLELATKLLLNSKLGFQYKQIDSAKTIADEWLLRVAGTVTTGYSWSYERKFDESKLSLGLDFIYVEGIF